MGSTSKVKHFMKTISQFLLGVVLLALGMSVSAHNLNITNVALTGATSTTIQVQYNMFWDNSWRDAENWDAVWVFIKYTTNSGSTWGHATLSASGHVAGTASPSPTVHIPQDNLGAFIYRSAAGIGTYTISGQQLQWNFSANGLNQTQAAAAEVRVFGIEMVYIPQGPYALGDGVNYTSTSISPSSGAFRRNFTNRAVYITNTISDSILDANAGIYFRVSGTSGIDLNNDGVVGVWPTDAPNFPVGFNAFYCMKYEMTQGQYCDYLNTLTYTQQNYHAPNSTNVVGQNFYDGSTTTLPSHRCNIFVQTAGVNSSFPRVYTATRPDRAMNWINWRDAAAYADWACLRPMTDMEWEKAARGSLPAVQGEYAWGSTSGTSLSAISTGSENGQEISTSTSTNHHRSYNTSSISGGDGSFSGAPVRVGMFARSNTTRVQSGLSFYGCADMTGNVAEWVVNFGNLAGRSFTGLHGNGGILSNGQADVSFWPGINGNSSNSTANSSYSSGVSHSAGITWKDEPGSIYSGSSIHPISYRFNIDPYYSNDNQSGRYNQMGFRAVKSNL